MNSMKKRFWMVLISLGLLFSGSPDAAPPWTAAVLGRVQEARQRADLAPLQRRPDLDAVAQAYAEEIAGLPHKKRLTQTRPIEEDLERGGVDGFRRVSLHLDMGRGYRDLESSFSASWKKSDSAWRRSQDAGWDAVGVGAATGQDHWVVFVAILVEDIYIPADLDQLERATVAAVNEERAKLGLQELKYDERLRRAARLHSQSMARNDFFSHTGLDGSSVGDRTAAVAIEWAVVSENIHSNQGYQDPVAVAVSGWIDSPGHYENIVNPRVRQTAVGVAISDDGKLYFTQLFLLRKDD
jgi:uncharacterized protein YkwD